MESTSLTVIPLSLVDIAEVHCEQNRVEIVGNARSGLCKGSFSLVLSGVREGNFSDFGTEDPLQLECDPDDPLLADYGPWSSIYASTPLPDPQRFYLELSILLHGQGRNPRRVERYLNAEGGLRHWLSLVQERAYLLATAPDAIIRACEPLLEVQAVEFQVIPVPRLRVGPRPHAVRLGSSSWGVADLLEWTPLAT